MIMIHQPVHPYVSAEGWIDYHAAIAGAVPDLGVKYGVRDATTFAAVARDAGLDRFTWLAGAAELTAPAYWAVGAHAFTSGLANVNPGLALSMLEALRANEQEISGILASWGLL